MYDIYYIQSPIITFLQPVQSGVQPTALAYQKVIFAASRKQDTGLALRLLHDMIEHGLTPFVSTFGSVVAGLSRTGTPADCIRIIKLMQDVVCRPGWRVAVGEVVMYGTEWPQVSLGPLTGEFEKEFANEI